MARPIEIQVDFHCAPLRMLGYPAEAVRERAEHVVRNTGDPAGADTLSETA